MEELFDPSWKIALLLQLRPRGSLFLSGGKAASWKEPLEARGYRVVMADDAKRIAAAEGAYDAVLHFPFPRQRTSVHLPTLLRALGPQGQLLGLFRHRITLIRGVRECVRSLFSRDGVMQWQCDRQLGLAAMPAVEFWLPLPNLGNLEEFSSVDATEEVEASLGRGRLYSSFFRHCSDGIAVYAAKSDQSGAQLLLQHVAAGCRERGMDVGSLRMTRFDLRARGALVTILQSDDLPQELVCRFAHGADAQRRLQRHWDMQRMVRGDLSRVGMDRKVPGDVVNFDIGDDKCWIEHRINGTISWRLMAHHRGRLDAQLLGFLDALAQLAGDERLASGMEIDGQLEELCEPNLGYQSRLEAGLGAMRNYLATALRSESFRYGWAHGDFGYGNAVASPRSGQLEAVIDWETASRNAPIGTDFFNFLIQRSLTQTEQNLQESVSRLIMLIDTEWSGQHNTAAASFLNRYLPRPNQQLICLGVTLYRWIRRECRNARASNWSHDQLLAALREFMLRLQVH